MSALKTFPLIQTENILHYKVSRELRVARVDLIDMTDQNQFNYRISSSKDKLTKIIRQGHPQVLKDVFQHTNWLDAGLENLRKDGYNDMIQGYTSFLKSKISYHKSRPFFSGTFDYEEYISLRNVQDPNEGYETIRELLVLLEKIEAFVKIVFKAVRTYGSTECRVAALVPTIEESFNIYTFVLSMLTALHKNEGLAVLRNTFKNTHEGLKRIYAECSNITYLTSLLSIPRLGDCPDFLAVKPVDDSGRMRKEAERLREEERKREEERMAEERLMEERAREDEISNLQYQQQLQLQQQQQQMYEQQQQKHLYDQQQQHLYDQQQKSLYDQHQQQQQQQLQQQQAYELQLNQKQAYELQMQKHQQQLAAQNNTSATIQDLQAQLEKLTTAAADSANWAQKYEALAKLYAALRKEHVELLTRLKEVKAQSMRDIEALKMQHQQALTAALVESTTSGSVHSVLTTRIAGLEAELASLKGRDEECDILKEGVDQALSMLGQERLEFSKRSKAESSTILDLLFQGLATGIEGELSMGKAGGLDELIRESMEGCEMFRGAMGGFMDGRGAGNVISSAVTFGGLVGRVIREGGDAGKGVREAAVLLFRGVCGESLGNVDVGLRKGVLDRLSNGVLERLGEVGKTEVEGGMEKAALDIQEASIRLQALLASQLNVEVHGAILQAAMALTTAITYLIKCATDSQIEIADGEPQTPTQFYKKNNKWTRGLISAAHVVAGATVFLVETADGVVSGSHSWEQLVVAAQDVGVCTTQLVAAARVKAVTASKTQDRLEGAAVSVREATRMLVTAAKTAATTSAEEAAREGVRGVGGREAKTGEMEQQVRILELEKGLEVARYVLGEMRKRNYHGED